MKNPVRDWADIPASERMTPADLMECGGADWPGWMERKLRTLEDDSPLCHAACKFGNWGKFARCSSTPAPGQRYCGKHGGPARPMPKRRNPPGCSTCGRPINGNAKYPCSACQQQTEWFAAAFDRYAFDHQSARVAQRSRDTVLWNGRFGWGQ